MSIVAGIIASSVSGSISGLDPGGYVASLPTSQNSLRRCRYNNYHNEDPLYTFGKTPVDTQYTNQIYMSENLDYFTVEYNGWFSPPVTDNYKFKMTSDDGSYLWIGSSALNPSLSNTTISYGGPHGGGSYITSEKLNLISGQYYPIKILAGEISGGQQLDVVFIRDGNPTQTSLSDYVWSETTESSLVANSFVYLDASTYSGSGDWLDTGIATANAVLMNTPTWSNDFGGKFTLDANSLQYMQMPNLGTLNNFTISGWTKYSTQVSSGACLITEGYVGSDINFTIGHIQDNTYVCGGIWDQDTLTWYIQNGPIPELNKWYNYTLSFNGSQVKFYVNGTLMSPVSFGGTLTSSGQPIYIGRRWDNHSATASYISGDISIINIYNTCLTDAEIKQNYNYHKYKYGLDLVLAT